MLNFISLPFDWQHVLMIGVFAFCAYIIWQLLAPYKFRQSFGLVHGCVFLICGYLIWTLSFFLFESAKPLPTIAKVSVQSSNSKSEAIIMVARASLHIRKCANTACNSIGIIEKGEKLTVILGFDGDWAKVICPDSGFINSLWLEAPKLQGDSL
ncbi:SH3 domain-containing protein [Pseudoalteromonas sp. ZZD1]|uniref:SH3 domain-containing protein n=1 Tax=Pseudoalteromonas sp. ZZD1 TaxID=3139395 RepID=UPI003BAB236E